MTQAELTNALLGAVLGLLPITLTAFFDWQEKRDVADQRNQAIDVAHKRVNFLNDWVKAQENCVKENCTTDHLHAIKEDIASELNQLKQELAENLAALEQRTVTKTTARAQRSLLQNMFLAYFPRGAFAWALHIFYYMLLGMSVLIVAGGGYSGDNPEVWSWADFHSLLLGIVIFFVPMLALIQWLARLADKRARRIAGEAQRHLEAAKYSRPLL